MQRLSLIRRKAACLGLWVWLLYGIAVGGCALTDPKGDAMTQDIASGNAGKYAEGPAPAGYPYPPEGMWRRIVQVIAMPPDDLTYKKFGEIFGLEFDEDKMEWYGDKVSRKYFLASRNAIKNRGDSPFDLISLSQGAPDFFEGARRRLMSFHFELAYWDVGEQTLIGASEKYCIKPVRSDIETQGYYYVDPIRIHPPSFHPGRERGNLPYLEELFVDDLSIWYRSSKTIHLYVLRNGCLSGVLYTNSLKF